MALEDRTALGSFAETQMDGMSASGAKRPFRGMSLGTNGSRISGRSGPLMTLAV